MFNMKSFEKWKEVGNLSLRVVIGIWGEQWVMTFWIPSHLKNQYEIGAQTLNSASGTLDCQTSLWSVDHVVFLLSLPELHLLVQNCTPSSLWQNRAWLSASALYRRGLVSITGLRFGEERRCPGYCESLLRGRGSPQQQAFEVRRHNRDFTKASFAKVWTALQLPTRSCIQESEAGKF